MNGGNTGWRSRRSAAVLVALVFAVLGPAHGADTRPDEERLQQLRARIETLQQRLNETRGRRDSVREEVRDLERRIGTLLNNLRETEARMHANEIRLAGLKSRAASEHGNLDMQRKQLARQIYAAYVTGREEYPKMLLNQQNPASVARVLTYYQCLNQERADRISAIKATLLRLDALEQRIGQQNRELQALRTSQRQQQTELETARARRGELLASLNRQVRDRAQEIERLLADEKRLQQLVEELKTVLPQAALPPAGAEARFARTRGRLPLPTRGRIVAHYGAQKDVGNLRWRGLFIAGRPGQDVISVARGRVVFADWLRGFGLLLILDHGDGYMTLYGHNQSLHKAVGDWVEGGEVIASLGNTGDMPQPGLYFEIRQNGEPRDPLIWCKAR